MRDALLAAHDGRLVAPPRAVRTARRRADGAHRRAPHRRVVRLPLRTTPSATRRASSWWCCTTPAPGRSGRSPSARSWAPGAPAGWARVAVDALARPDAATLGVIGSGRQAWTQVWATAAVRPLREVTVHSRSAARREAFAARVRAELGVPARDGGSAPRRPSPTGTWWCSPPPAPTPVLGAADLAPGTHVNAVGFKQATGTSSAPTCSTPPTCWSPTRRPRRRPTHPPMLAAVAPYAGRLRDLGGGAGRRGPRPDRRGPDLGLLLHRPGRHRGRSCSTG